MSAALVLPRVWASTCRQRNRPAPRRVALIHASTTESTNNYAFYRKHTECLLRRYLYASMQVGRAPALLNDPVARGWASSRPVRSFEDAVIFVLDVEKCLRKLEAAEQQLINRITLQEYTYEETAELTGQSTRTIGYKYPRVMDRLTEILLSAGLLTLPATEGCQANTISRRCRSR